MLVAYAHAANATRLIVDCERLVAREAGALALLGFDFKGLVLALETLYEFEPPAALRPVVTAGEAAYEFDPIRDEALILQRVNLSELAWTISDVGGPNGTTLVLGTVDMPLRIVFNATGVAAEEPTLTGLTTSDMVQVRFEVDGALRQVRARTDPRSTANRA